MGGVLPKYNCFYKKTEKITDCISFLSDKQVDYLTYEQDYGQNL